MGRALARLMAARGDRICLLGRDVAELERSAAGPDDPRRRPRGAWRIATWMSARIFAARWTKRRGSSEASTWLSSRLRTSDPGSARGRPRPSARLLTVNFTNTILFCEAARERLLGTGVVNPTFCVFSSVAGERGRKPCVFYGAAKAGLSRYLEGLDHKYFGRGSTM